MDKAYVEQAKKVGFTTAADKISASYDLAKKLLIAYADYKIVTEADINAFNQQLRTKTEKKPDRYNIYYKKLVFDSIATYGSFPPAEVLQAVQIAQDKQIFDSFKVAYIADIHERRDPDPIVFGTIEGCSDYFFIAQWGDDVKISDLLVEPSNDNR